MSKQKKEYLEIAKIINTHGVRGDLKAELWCDSDKVLRSISTLYLDDSGTKPLKISNPRMHGRFLLIHAEGIDSPESAETVKNKILYAKREDIPLAEGSVFIADLIGLPVTDADSGIVYGVLNDVLEYPSSSLYEVKTQNKTVLIPAVKEFITAVDPDRGVFVRPIPGMFTEAVFGQSPQENNNRKKVAKP